MLEKSLPAETAQAQSRQAQRMEIVGQLTGGIVHDFNNILTVIAGTIEILSEAVADRPDLAAIAALITEASTRGANLTSHLLTFARGQPSRPREVEVNALLVEAARLLRPTLGEQIEIDSVLAIDVPPVLVDSSQLMTALLNLAIMARDAMPEGGTLTFETRIAAAVESCVNANGEASAGDYVMIAASAAGYGISADHLGQAFTDLSMIEDFIKQSNARIKVCREAGRGASVQIYLPRLAGRARSPVEEAGKARIEGGDEAILIVEDDVLVRQYVVTQLQTLGYRTLVAGNASEALAMIDAGEEFDLLFTDVVMPGLINGWQLAIEALKRRPSLKVLYTTGYAENALVRDRRLEGGALLLAKPYRKIDLAKMIRTALAA
jgi:CheY-like chemotaxis protein